MYTGLAISFLTVALMIVVPQSGFGNIVLLVGFTVEIVGLGVIWPGLVVPGGFLSAPAVIAFAGILHEREVWHSSWFWLFSAFCALASAIGLAWFEKRYAA